ncbi:MAG: hypothetical protein P1S60_18120 [Anaerolineae bacterium]|nr:hypothetical protein [Anaerolineae bacterium]
MKNALQNLGLASTRINSQHVRLFWLVLSVGLFVLGAAAPGGDGGGHVGG